MEREESCMKAGGALGKGNWADIPRRHRRHVHRRPSSTQTEEKQTRSLYDPATLSYGPQVVDVYAGGGSGPHHVM